jgi:mono/diheme cytochrome c family protein
MSQARRLLSAVIVAVGIGLLGLAMAERVQSQPPAQPMAVASAVPQGQSYTGVKKCSSCHFKQFVSWNKTKHAKEAFQSVPAKYRKDPKCITCHTTGYGEPTGFKDETSTPNLAGTTCEACHGPGSKHEEIAKKYTNKKKLAPNEEAEVRGSIYKTLPQNVCILCHAAKGHKEHPAYDKR